MKTHKIFSKLLLLPIAALIPLTSCLDKEDIPPIAIGNFSLYVIQQTVAVSEEYEYLPHIGFWYNGKEELNYGVISKDGENLEVMTSKDLAVCQIDPQKYKTTNIGELSGKYTLNPVGVDGHDWERSFTVEFNGDNFVADFGVTEFSYNGGRVTVTFKKASILQSYGLYIQPYINGSITPYYAYIYPTEKISPYYVNAVFEDDIYLTLEYAFNPRYYSSSDGLVKFRITPMASRFSTKGDWRVIRLSSVYGDITADDYNKEVVFLEPQPEE